MTSGFLISLLAIIAVSVVVYRVFAFLREDAATVVHLQEPAPETSPVPVTSLNGSY